jgi:hypothetical protein
MTNAVAGNRLLQCLGHVLLPDQFLETLRPVPASDDNVAAGGLAVFRRR